MSQVIEDNLSSTFFDYPVNGTFGHPLLVTIEKITPVSSLIDFLKQDIFTNVKLLNVLFGIGNNKNYVVVITEFC